MTPAHGSVSGCSARPAGGQLPAPQALRPGTPQGTCLRNRAQEGGAPQTCGDALGEREGSGKARQEQRACGLLWQESGFRPSPGALQLRSHLEQRGRPFAWPFLRWGDRRRHLMGERCLRRGQLGAMTSQHPQQRGMRARPEGGHLGRESPLPTPVAQHSQKWTPISPSQRYPLRAKPQGLHISHPFLQQAHKAELLSMS